MDIQRTWTLKIIKSGEFAVYDNPPGMVNNPISLHLISEDIYFDVLFHSWTSGSNGGGFSYTRTCVLPPWLRVSQASGVLPPGSSEDIEAAFDASYLEGGDYNGIIAISNNDPINPVVNIPVLLEVIDAPSVHTDNDTLDFGILYIGFDNSDTLQLEVTNTGSLDLLLTSVTTTPDEFSVSPVFAGIDPGGTEIFTVIFSPDNAGTYSGLLTFNCNDPLMPEYNVFLTGRYLLPPEISVAPDSLSAELYSGKSATRSFTINNNGGSDLAYTVIPGAKNALHLDGQGDYVKVDNSTTYQLNQFTLEAWVYEDVYQDGAGIITCGNSGDYRFTWYFCCGGGMVYVQDWSYSILSPSLPTNTWQHLAVTHDGSRVRMYVNGELVAESVIPSPYYSSTGYSLYIGNEIIGSPEYLNGRINEVRIWNYALSQEEIRSKMYFSLAGNESGLVGYWPMDEISGTLAHDKTINSNNGILYGEADWGYYAMGQVPWLSCEPSSGVLSIGTSVDIEVTFDASNLTGGDYLTDIIILSNDPADPVVEIPATLQVTDTPSFYPEKDTLDFGNVFIGYSDTLKLVIENKGSQDLLIFSAVTEPEEYTVFPPYASVDPGGTETFTVTFTPMAVGDYDGTFLCTSNDPLVEEYIIILRGRGVEPPVISVSPDSLVVEVLSGQTTTKPFIINNTGGSDLNFTITPGEGSHFALEFDGSDDYINLGDNINIADKSLTVEAWVKQGIPWGWHIIWGQGIPSTNSGLIFGFTDSDTFVFGFCNNDLVTSTTYTDNEWHHWASTFDVSTKARKIYRDGIEVADDITWANYQGTGQSFIGKATWDNNNCFLDFIDDVRIWKVVRTQDEIQQKMVQELFGNEPGLIGYWDFDEGTGLNVYDKSPNGNNGTLINGVTWTNVSIPLGPAWISVSQESGAIPANSSLDIEAIFNAEDIEAGDYFATLRIYSNDPITPLASIPVHMIVNSGVGIPSVGSSQFAVRSFPNPFSDYTTFEYELEESGTITLTIFNQIGQEIDVLVNERQDKGKHQVRWNTEGLPGGIYFYRILNIGHGMSEMGKLVKY